MKLKEPVLKILNKQYEPSTKNVMREELKIAEDGRVIKYHWEHKGKAT